MGMNSTGMTMNVGANNMGMGVGMNVNSPGMNAKVSFWSYRLYLIYILYQFNLDESIEIVSTKIYII